VIKVVGEWDDLTTLNRGSPTCGILDYLRTEIKDQGLADSISLSLCLWHSSRRKTLQSSNLVVQIAGEIRNITRTLGQGNHTSEIVGVTLKSSNYKVVSP